MRLREEQVTSRTQVVGQQESIRAFLEAYVMKKAQLQCLYEHDVRCEELNEYAIEIISFCGENDLKRRVETVARYYPELLIVSAFVHPSKTRVGGIAIYKGVRSASQDWLPILVPVVDDVSLGGYFGLESSLEEEAMLHQVQVCLESLKSERPELEQHIRSYSPFLEVS